MKEPQLGVYPANISRNVKLRDGTRVLLRPIKPEDADLWVQLYESLSSMSKYYRFFTSHQKPSEKLIKMYTQIDYVTNFALVAITKQDGKERMIGVARYVLDPPKIPPENAELAVVVSDEWQSKGLGTHLLIYLLEIMVKRKIKKVHGDVFLENQAMLKLMTESGFKLTKQDSQGIRHFEFTLQS